MTVHNPLRRFADKVNRYPAGLGPKLISWVFGRKVKLVGTAGLEMLETDAHIINSAGGKFIFKFK